MGMRFGFRMFGWRACFVAFVIYGYAARIENLSIGPIIISVHISFRALIVRRQFL